MNQNKELNNFVLQPEPVRDGVQNFCEKHMSSIRNFINNVSARIPIPSICKMISMFLYNIHYQCNMCLLYVHTSIISYSFWKKINLCSQM